MPEVRYNGYDLPNIFGKFSLSETHERLTFSCNFLIVEGSESALISECKIVEEKLSEINKDFKLVYGGATHYDVSHTQSTGFLSRPRIVKMTTPFSAGTMRPYTFSVDIQLPMTQYGFRRSVSYTVSFVGSRQKLVSFSLVYTAGGSGSNTATENYEDETDGGKAYALAILADFGDGSKYDLISENLNKEQEDKVITASLQYKQIIGSQSEANYNESVIIDSSATYSINFEEQVGIAQNYVASPQVTISVNYQTTIDKEQVPDEAAIEDIYQTTIKPYLINHARVVLGLENYPQVGHNYIIQSEQKTVNVNSYTVSGALSFMAPRTNSTIIMLSETVNKRIDDGISFDKLWDGQPNTYNIWGIGSRTTLDRTITISKLGSPPSPPQNYTDDSTGTWIRRSINERRSRVAVGMGTVIPDSPTTTNILYTYAFMESYILVVPVAGVGGVVQTVIVP